MRRNLNCERIIHQSGSCFVWNWRPKRNQNIIIFPKTCVYKTRTTRYKNIYRLLKNYAGIHPKHPQTIGVHRGGKDMEDPGPCTSRERLVTASPFRICQWLLQPSTSISGVLGIFHLLSSQWPKNTSYPIY